MFVVQRSHHNPIMIPDRNHYWEEFAVFNMCPVKKGKTIYAFYRAISAHDKLQTPEQTSVIGIGKSKDGLHFEDREKFIVPEYEWEQFGCEDPRATYFEGKFYVFYTALSRYPFGPEGIKVAVAISKDLKKVDEKHFVTPFNSKAMALFPERIGDKIAVIFSADTDQPPAKMSIAYANKMEDLWNPKFWEKWHKNIDKYTIDPKRNPGDHVEVGAPPIKTKYGWLIIYSHIQNYFNRPDGQDLIFGIEAMLLDLKNPTKIIGKTTGPILVPEEPYELSGYVSNVVFPTGALLDKDTLTIYYGAADTTVCKARVSLQDLISTIHPKMKETWHFKRFSKNPIISPDINHSWESKATFNPASIELGGKTHIIYRAMSEDNTSTLGYASSKDGLNLIERLKDPVYVPRVDIEMKKIPNGNSGCEDPRLTQIGNKIYMCYTAYDSVSPPRVAISYITEKDFLAKKWNWSEPFAITPRDMDDKDTCLFSEKFKQGYFVIHRINNEICGDFLNTLDFNHEMVNKCIRILGPRKNMWDSAKVGIAAPPMKTKYGWLLLYHGVSKSHSTYRIGAVLLDLEDPAIVLARTTDPIFEPETEYEKKGIVNNVVFPCGMVVKKGVLHIYYGGGDRVTGVATMKFDNILQALLRGIKNK